MAKKKPYIRLRPKLDPAGEGYPVEMRGLLALGRPKEETDYSEWAERLRDHVPQLIQMTLDDELSNRPEKDRALWAPLHALSILAELAPIEAAEPLLEVFEWEDDWTDVLLPKFYAAVGAPAIPLLQQSVADRSRTHYARGAALVALAAIAQAHVSTRDEVVRYLVERLEPTEADGPEEEYVITTAVLALTDLRAVEALPAIERAFESNLVETFMVSLEDVKVAFDLTPSPAEGDALRESVSLSLKCLACGREREYRFDRVYYDVSVSKFAEQGAMGRALYTPEPVVCQRCGAVEQVELGSMGHMAVTTAVISQFGGVESPLTNLKLVSLPRAPWGWLPPREALARYREEIAAHPSDLMLRVNYADALALVEEHAASSEQYEHALLIDPLSGEAVVGLAELMADQGSIAAAIAAWERVERDADRLRFVENDHADRNGLRAMARHALTHLRAGERLPKSFVPSDRGVARGPSLPQTAEAFGAPWGPLPGQQSEFVKPDRGEFGKVGRNEPCPCGSGKKYKQCHGRK